MVMSSFEDKKVSCSDSNIFSSLHTTGSIQDRVDKY